LLAAETNQPWRGIVLIEPRPDPRLKYSSPGPPIMSNAVKHISVCICTYKRPQLLEQLLRELAGQDTNGRFTYSIVIVDNDKLRSAEGVAVSFAAESPLPVRYCVEARQNIALARNTAVANSEGDFIAFIDDDEFPTRSWLLTLFNALNA